MTGRILVYRALGLGDFLTAVPACRAVRRAFPAEEGYEVSLAAPEPLRPLVELCGAVDRLLPTRELQPPAWEDPVPPAVAVNLHGRGPQSHRLLQRLRPRRLVAFANARAGTAGPSWRRDEHEVARWCRLLTQSGIPADPEDLWMPPPDVIPRAADAVIVHPGATAPARRWPAERFAAVARTLADAGATVVVTGVPSERPLARAVAAGAGLSDEHVLAGRLDLRELAALVAAARLVVCGDTGVAHVATAYGTTSVVLFGAMQPALWGPPAGRAEHRALWHAELASGHAVPGRPHPALLAIGVDEVLASAATLQPSRAPE